MSTTSPLVHNEPNQSTSPPIAGEKSYFALEVINGIRFTPREIDIIACILGGRGRKTAGSLLSIAEKTVETHIRNILSKLGCHSQEGIRERLEKSDKFTIIKQHYLNLLTAATFEQTLQEILVLVGKRDVLCLFMRDGGERPFSLFESLKKHFGRIGIHLLLGTEEHHRSLALLIEEGKLENVDYIIYVVSQSFSCPEQTEPVREILDVVRKGLKPFVFLLDKEENPLSCSQGISQIEGIPINEENYHVLFLKILKKIFSEFDFNNIITSFVQRYESINGIGPLVFPKQQDSPATPSNQLKQDPLTSHFFKHREKWLIGAGILFFIGINVGILLLFFNNLMSKQNDYPTPSIRSDFIVPVEAVFLQRPELLSEIGKKFNNQPGIQTIALVGTGGSGKTTLARQYGSQQRMSMVWEIHAETLETLQRSFENLARALAKTEEEKEKLSRVFEVKDNSKREEDLISFVKDRIKLQKNWLLIYDNVENSADIQKYFPQDASRWGSGRVIVTTRDSTIQRSKLINAIIFVGQLSSHEKLDLFVKITDQEVGRPLSSSKIDQIKLFLEKIPSFPLDVSTAAYYLKATNTPYATYLENMHQCDQDFINVQESLLKEAGDYTKSRYAILTLSLQRLLNTHKDFKDLLVLITLLGSQHIPIDLLKKYKSNPVVDNFIYHLKKYSLILNESSSSFCETTFSIHHSTQAIALAYLIKNLQLKAGHEKLREVGDSLENYIDEAMSHENLSTMKLLVNHCERFLSHRSLLTEQTRASVQGAFGSMLFYLFQYRKAKNLLENSLPTLRKLAAQNPVNFARALAHLGNVYRESGDYDRAKELLEQAFAIYQKSLSENHLKIAQTAAYLGNLYRNLGDYTKAKTLLERSLKIYGTHFPNNHIGISRLFSYLGNVYKEQGRYIKAKDYIEKSLEIYKKYSPDNYVGITRSLIYLANIHKTLDNYQEARILLEDSLTLYKRYLSEDHSDFYWVFVYLGNIHLSLGNYEKANNLLREACLIRKKFAPYDQLDVGWISTYQGHIFLELGQYEKAKTLFEKSLQIYKEYLSKDNVDVALTNTLLAGSYNCCGHYEKARNLLENALLIYRKNFPENHFDVAWTKLYLGNVYYNLKNYAKSQFFLEEALSTYKAVLNEDSLKVASVQLCLGKVCLSLGEMRRAKTLFEKTLKVYEKHYGKDHLETSRVLLNMAQVYLLEGKINEAEHLIRKTLNTFQQYNHPDAYMAFEALAQLALKKEGVLKIKPSSDLRGEAIAHLKQALEITKAHFLPDSAHIFRIQECLRKLESK